MSLHLVHTDETGKLAVIAVLLQQGQDNPLVRELYYTFSGSLTTPPCSEDVTWFVLKHPTTVSAEEIERFSKLYRNDARPTQPLYDRIVLESQ